MAPLVLHAVSHASELVLQGSPPYAPFLRAIAHASLAAS